MLLIFPTAVIAIAADMRRDYSGLISLSTGAFVAFGLFALPVGWLADRFGRRALLSWFFFGYGAACILVGASANVTMLAVSLLILGIFSAIYHPIGSAMVVANAAKDAYDFLGTPEGELALAQACVHMACAPKSNAVYTAFGAARRLAKETGSLMPPAPIRNAPTRLMKDLGYGKGYRYDPDTPEGFSGQNYFPDGVDRQVFYTPRGEGAEVRVHLYERHPTDDLGETGSVPECD